MYQLLKGIIKVINPKGKTVIGVADGVGQFVWLPSEVVKGSFPSQPYANWQTTLFLIDPNYKIVWKPERNWDQYKGTYTPQNIIPIPQPIPPVYLSQEGTTVPIQQPIAQTTTTKSPATGVLPIMTQNIPIPTINVQTTTPFPNNEKMVLDELRIISDNIYKMLQLFQKFMKEPLLETADNLMSNDQVKDEYGIPPDDDDDVSNDELPDVFFG